MRFFNRRRRSYASYGERRLSPWLIIAICAASALILTVIIGNLLGLWLDEDTLRALKEELRLLGHGLEYRASTRNAPSGSVARRAGLVHCGQCYYYVLRAI